MPLPNLGRGLELCRDSLEQLLDVQLVVPQRREVLLQLRASPVVRLKVTIGGKAAVVHGRTGD